MFIENVRFDKDFAIHDKKKRMEEQYRKVLALEKQRLERLNRDAQRWEDMERQEMREDARMAYKTEVFKVGKKNASGYVSNNEFLSLKLLLKQHAIQSNHFRIRK